MPTQYQEVAAYCSKQDRYFTLSQVYADIPGIPQPSIRALLQQARDKGLIFFVDNKGSYLRR